MSTGSPGSTAGGPAPARPVVAWWRDRDLLVDAALAGVLFVAVLLTGSGYSSAPGTVMVVSAALLAPLAWRRRAPVPAALAVTAVALVELVVVPEFLLANVAAPVMVYALAAYAPHRWRNAGLALGFVGAVLAALRYFGAVSIDGTFRGIQDVEGVVVATGAISLLVVAAWATGSVKRARLLREQSLRERAELLEVERVQELRLAATAERARIAREMHDVVAHSLSVVIAQADGGRYAGRTDPQAALGALEQVAATGRQALGDMRSLLGVLREDDVRDLAPQPAVADVATLVADVRRSGLEVELVEDGAPGPLGAGAQLAAYRVVQEALTNVLKHAGPGARASVGLHWAGEALTVSVTDDGRGAAGALGRSGQQPGQERHPGHGLRGMRERAVLHGGRVEAGPRPGGGFGVHAVLPYHRAR